MLNTNVFNVSEAIKKKFRQKYRGISDAWFHEWNICCWVGLRIRCWEEWDFHWLRFHLECIQFKCMNNTWICIWFTQGGLTVKILKWRFLFGSYKKYFKIDFLGFWKIEMQFCHNFVIRSKREEFTYFLLYYFDIRIFAFEPRYRIQ